MSLNTTRNENKDSRLKVHVKEKSYNVIKDTGKNRFTDYTVYFTAETCSMCGHHKRTSRVAENEGMSVQLSYGSGGKLFLCLSGF